MAYMVANVPLIPQDKNMACWYASAQMLISWRRSVRRMTESAHPDPSQVPALVATHKANDGLGVVQITTLAQMLGLRTVPPQSPTLEAVESWLRRCGPLWFAGLMPSGHVVVITGIGPVGLQIHDPWPPGKGMNRTMTIQEFVRVLQPLGSSTLAPNFLHFPG